MYRGFENMLSGRDPSDALVIVPRICGICSVSQSVAAARALADALAALDLRQPRPTALITGMLANKDADGFFDAFRLAQAPVLTVPFEGACRSPADLAEAARRAGLAAEPMVDVETALKAALAEGAGRVLICGSLYLAGEVLGASPETWPT